MIRIFKTHFSKVDDRYAYRNTILLVYNNWNDFGYQTTFNIKLFDACGNSAYEGLLQIYTERMDDDNYESQDIDSYLSDGEINNLNESFCSLGSDLNYYITLKKIFPKDYIDVLQRLRDIAYSQDLWARFSFREGVLYSLLRSSSAAKARIEAFNYLNGIIVAKKDMSFSYSARVPYSCMETILHFNFTRNSHLPYRINAIIGKNGVGKTHIIQDLAVDISGFISNEQEMIERRKRFIGSKDRPSFNKVISISFSAFDPFDKRRGNDSLCSYVYCGIQTKDGIQTIEQIRSNIKTNLKRIKEKNRLNLFNDIILELFKHENVEDVDIDSVDSIHLSSGECVLLYSMSEVVLNIEPESIVLFDEPELHLHPNAISNVMRMLDLILNKYDSYAIIATHSPLILQEIPSNNVLVMQRVDDIPTVRPPEVECFGESVSLIVRDVFYVDQDESYYQSVITSMKEAGVDKKTILSEFKGKLGLNALMALEAIYDND